MRKRNKQSLGYKIANFAAVDSGTRPKRKLAAGTTWHIPGRRLRCWRRSARDHRFGINVSPTFTGYGPLAAASAIDPVGKEIRLPPTTRFPHLRDLHR